VWREGKFRGRNNDRGTDAPPMAGDRVVKITGQYRVLRELLKATAQTASRQVFTLISFVSKIPAAGKEE